MNIYDATEQAYKRGFERGSAEGYAKGYKEGRTDSGYLRTEAETDLLLRVLTYHLIHPECSQRTLHEIVRTVQKE